MKIATFSTLEIPACMAWFCAPGVQETKLPADAGTNVSYMDPTAKSTDDFWRYVNGGWIDLDDIRADPGAYGSFM